MTPAERYARSVTEGKIITGKWVKLAAARFLNDLTRDDLVFDEREANRAVNFIERKLRHWEGAFGGKPLILEDWQKFIVMQIFGWFLPEVHPSGVRLRRVRSVYIQIARKNGKTAFLAAIILYHIIADSEKTPQVLVGANNEDQAKICTNSVGQMALASPELRDLYDDQEIKLSTYNGKIFALQYPERIGEMRAMSKNPETKDGYGASLGGVDEYHEAKDDKLLNVIESGQGSRINPLLIVITTAGFDKDGPCYSKLRESSVQILTGTIEDEHHLAFIYEQDESDEVADESTWVKSNPNLGVSVSIEFLRSRYKKALNEGGTKMVDFLTKNLNRWVDAPEVWIPNELYILNNHGNHPDMLKGMPCYGGIDLGRTSDLNAFGLLFPNFKDDLFAILPFFWQTEAKVKANTDRVDYRKWAEQGYITITEGNVADYKHITHDILNNILPQYDFKSASFDRYLMGHGVIVELLDAGLQLHELIQNIVSLNMPTKELERLMMNAKFETFGNPVLQWCFQNTNLTRDSSGNVKPDKKEERKKIEGVSVTVNALAEYLTFGGQQIDLTFTAIK